MQGYQNASGKVGREKKNGDEETESEPNYYKIRAFAYAELGLKPKEYNAMTERDFYLLCHGYQEKMLRKARERRQLMYTIVCGYADPKKLPPVHRWMPLEGDEVPVVPQERIKELAERFRSLSWQNNRTVN